ncbi:uncharacterized protein LY79DRAFT_667348 [Colletotrichum navitas]|uniref:Uncharacterized protein n=1 Tax=Colletotrichum navitas TaxID=681940 RepID=A0AAD8Q5L1_9PEZI|nr:uncharacterized protein LY79DRAFT_667348 [Colletotrichum navitas]KAK1596302.1 hypothetical protein LY79DRAFT_667348 [Colletotrichum navitas]
MRFSRIFHRRFRLTPHTRLVVADRERSRSLSKRTTASWDCPLAAEAWDRMKRGYQPESMDDRWVVSLTGEDKLVFARSWTRSPIVEIRVVARDYARIVSIAWEGDESVWTGGSEKSAKKLVVQLCASLLDVRLSPGNI